MNPERIAEIVDKVIPRICFSDVPEAKNWMIKAIQEALEEENRWFYPSKGEFPEEKTPIIYVFCSRIEHGYYTDNKFIPFSWNENNKFRSQIKCWRYAPVVPEE